MLQRPPFLGRSLALPTNGLQFNLPLWDVNQQGFCLSYDGNDYLSNATADFRSGDSEGAIEVWFRISNLNGYPILFSTSDTGTTTSYIKIYCNQTTGELTLLTQNAAGTAHGVFVSTINWRDGKWHHAVVSSSGTAWSILVDGVDRALEAASSTNNGDWFADITLRDNLTIGAETNTSTANYTTGEIGFTRIYSRPMLQPEAQTNYQRGRKAVASDATGLVFNLPTTEGTGNPVDTVGSLTMTVTGATWVEGLMDKSVNALPATAFGTTWGNQGRTLDGDDSLSIPDANSLDLGAMTVMAWFQHGVALTEQTILAKGQWDGNSSNYNLSVTSAQKLRGFCGYTTGWTGARVTGGTTLALNTWYFGAYTYDLATANLYLNGITDASPVSVAVTPTTNAENLRLGAWGVVGGVGAFLTGKEGEIQIYNRALSAGEIRLIYDRTKFRYGK